MNIETRTAHIKQNGKLLQGNAIVFDSLSEDLGGFREVITPNAFDKHLATVPDIRALFEHDGKQLLGRTSSGTLELTATAKGIEVSINPPNTQAGNDARELVGRGDINGMSFGFRTIRDDFDFNTTPPTRYILEAELHEVTVTANPAYKASTVSLRAAQGNTDTTSYWRELELLEL